MVPRIPCELSELASDNPPINIKAHSKVRAFRFAFFGAIKIGAVAIPVNTQAKPRAYEYILNDSLARVAIVSESLLPQLQAIPRQNLTHLREIVVVGAPDHAPSYSCFQDLI